MQGEKKVFINLLSFLVILLFFIIIILNYIVKSRCIYVYDMFIIILIAFFCFIGFFFTIGIFALVFTIHKKKSSELLNTFITYIVDMSYPILLIIGKIIGIKREKLQRSFIEINNLLVSSIKKKYRPEDILILSPHCIQNSDCKFKVTYDIENCRRCGKCQINDLLKLKDKYGVKIAVATGGTLARKVVSDIKPKIIIAIACERDLTSGIKDVKKIPVYGIINKRPNGPCFNTSFDVKSLEKVIINFISGG